MSTHIPDFEIALAASDFTAIEGIWLNLLDERPGDAETFLSLASRLAKRREVKRAATLLLMCVGPLKERKQYQDAFNVVCAAAEYGPREKKLWDEVVALVPKVFSGYPEIEQIIANGRDQHEGQVGPFIDYIRTWTAFQIGDYVEHNSGWGVGQVAEVVPSEGKLTIDFISKKGHRFALEAAGRMLQRLDKDDFRVWKAYRLGELQERCKTDPLGVVKMALRSERNRTLSQREIKTRLVPAVLDSKTWSKFLTGIKKAAQKDDFIRVGQGANPDFSLLEEAVTFADTALDRFMKPGSWDEKLERARTILTQIQEHGYDPNEIVPAIIKVHRRMLDEDEAGMRPSTFAAVQLLEEVAQSHPAIAKAELGDELPSLDLFFDSASPTTFVEILSQVPVARYQREGLARALSAAGDAWETTVRAALATDSQPLWDEALRQCDRGHRMDLIDAFGDQISVEPGEHADNFLWYARQVFVRHKASEKGGEKADAASVMQRYRLFEKLLSLATRLNHLHSRGSKSARASLMKLKTVLGEDQNFMLGAIVKHITPDQAAHLYHHLEACTALGNTLPPKMRRMIRKVHPSVEAAVVDESEGYHYDPSVTLTTRRGLALQQRRQQQVFDAYEENKKAIGAALEMGDISENAELDAAREKESRLKQQLADMSEALKSVRVLESADVDTGVVSPGTRVTWTDEITGEAETRIILGPWDSDHTRNIISYLAPLAQAALGAAVGDVIVLAAQGQRRVRIEKIENALEDGYFDTAPDDESEASGEAGTPGEPVSSRG